MVEALGAITTIAYVTMAMPACLESWTAWVELWEARAADTLRGSDVLAYDGLTSLGKREC